MSQTTKLVVLNMTVSGTIDMGALTTVLDALKKHRQIGGLEELESFLANPSGIAVAIPQWGSGFDLKAVHKRAQNSCVAVQNLTFDGITQMVASGKSVTEVIQQLGL